MNRLCGVINDTIISFPGQTVNWILTLLLTIAYRSFLEDFKLGEPYFAVPFVTLIGYSIKADYDTQARRDVAHKTDKVEGSLSNLLLIRPGTWFILYTIVFLASYLLDYSPEVRVLVWICGVDLLCNALVSTFASLRSAFERMIFPVVGNILEKGLSTLFDILLLISGART
jgi:hypothetical protein